MPEPGRDKVDLHAGVNIGVFASIDDIPLVAPRDDVKTFLEITENELKELARIQK